MSTSTIIKVNGMTINISNKSTESVFDIDKESKALESLALDISKSVEAFNIISNVKAMEAFGYQTTEGFGDKLKAGAKVVWEKIKQFFINLGKFIKNFFKLIVVKISNSFAQFKAKFDKNRLSNLKDNNDTINVSKLTYFLVTNRGGYVPDLLSKAKIEFDELVISFGKLNEEIDKLETLHYESSNAKRKYHLVPNDKLKTKLHELHHEILTECFNAIDNCDKIIDMLGGEKNITSLPSSDTTLTVSKLYNYYYLSFDTLCDSMKDFVESVNKQKCDKMLNICNDLSDVAESAGKAEKGIPFDSGLSNCLMSTGNSVNKYITKLQKVLLTIDIVRSNVANDYNKLLSISSKNNNE